MELLTRLQNRHGVRLGIIGGSFDPVHNGHLLLADQALHQFSLDEMLFMPTGTPPHKTRVMTDPELRYLMVAAAIAPHPRFHISRHELDLPGLDYTADTLDYLASRLPEDARLFFVAGADAVLDMPGWKDPARILARATVIAGTRPGFELDRLERALVPLGGAGPIEIMEIPDLAISSSDIRQRVAAGGSIRYLVPGPVWELIRKWHLYEAAAT